LSSSQWPSKHPCERAAGDGAGTIAGGAWRAWMTTAHAVPFQIRPYKSMGGTDGDGWTGVRTGVPCPTRRAAETLRERLDGKPIRRVIVTHLPSDHMRQRLVADRTLAGRTLVPQTEWLAAEYALASRDDADSPAGRPYRSHASPRSKRRRCARGAIRYPSLVGGLPFHSSDRRQRAVDDRRAALARDHSARHSPRASGPVRAMDLSVLIEGATRCCRRHDEREVGPSGRARIPCAYYRDSPRAFSAARRHADLQSHGMPFRGLHHRMSTLVTAPRRADGRGRRRRASRRRRARKLSPCCSVAELDTHQLGFPPHGREDSPPELK